MFLQNKYVFVSNAGILFISLQNLLLANNAWLPFLWLCLDNSKHLS